MQAMVIIWTYHNGKSKFITFENDQEVQSIVIYVSGVLGHSFYDIFTINEEVPETLQHQQAIMNFFEDQHASKLHYLGKSTDSEILSSLGFTLKEQIYLKMKKPVY